ncbi:hypothetical protein LZ32DRAFT_59635 [Colletotrichum eremochloae]|nr:hypothetical protein LZ32DRAFT_59635 [Colletotrichum eremochloae]
MAHIQKGFEKKTFNKVRTKKKQGHINKAHPLPTVHSRPCEDSSRSPPRLETASPRRFAAVQASSFPFIASSQPKTHRNRTAMAKMTEEWRRKKGKEKKPVKQRPQVHVSKLSCWPPYPRRRPASGHSLAAKKEGRGNPFLAPESTRHPKHALQTNKTSPLASFPAPVSDVSALGRSARLPGAAPPSQTSSLGISP